MKVGLTSATETQFIHMKQGVILHANTGFINCIVLCFVVGGFLYVLLSLRTSFVWS